MKKILFILPVYIFLFCLPLAMAEDIDEPDLNNYYLAEEKWTTTVISSDQYNTVEPEMVINGVKYYQVVPYYLPVISDDSPIPYYIFDLEPNYISINYIPYSRSPSEDIIAADFGRASSPKVIAENGFITVNGVKYSTVETEGINWRRSHYKEKTINIDGVDYFRVYPENEIMKDVKVREPFPDSPKIVFFEKDHVYKADLRELTTHEHLELEGDYALYSPYMAVYGNNGKVLIYIAAQHEHEVTIKMVDSAFKEYNPEVVLVEVDNDNELFDIGEKCSAVESDYAVAMASEKGIPIVFADLNRGDMLAVLDSFVSDADKAEQAYTMLSYGQMLEKRYGNLVTAEEVVNYYSRRVRNSDVYVMDAKEAKQWYFDNFAIDFDTTDLNTFFYPAHSGYYDSVGDAFKRYEIVREYYARDPFMLKNIAAALNKYDVVLAIFGAAHHRNAKKVLTKMTGDYDPNFYGYLNSDGEENEYWRNYENPCKGKAVKTETLVQPKLQGYGVK